MAKYGNMNAHKYFHCLSEKYSLLIPHLRCTRNVFRIARKKTQHSCFIWPGETSFLSLKRIDNDFSLKRLFSQVPDVEQAPKKCSPTFTKIEPIKFEEMYFDPPVTHEHLLAELGKCKTITEQMVRLASTLALSADDIGKRFEFCKKIETLFQPFFHNFKIQMFGSTVNCFGFKGCDIDMTFETSADCKDQTFYLETPDVPLVSEVVSGKVSPQELSEMPYKEQLLFIHTVFLEYYNESEASPIFINAHVPLVRFYHDKYGLKCDLTFKNKVAFANTKLLYLFAKLDHRVIPFMMTLRYWAKHNELIGKGLMFNTYTISLLAIYFLQTRSQPILPSAEYILSLSSSLEVDDMSDKSFLNILADIPTTKNTQTLDELLKEFFFFYLYFDFTRVICPLTAKAVPRDEFFSMKENTKFKMNTLCIQDPLCLPHNVAELVDYKTCRKFYVELAMTCKMYQDSEISLISDNWGLISVLDKPKKFSVRNINDQKLFSFTLPVISKTEDNESSELEKAAITADTVIKILEQALLFECKLLGAESVQNLLIRLDELIALQKKQIEAKNLFQSELDKIRKKASKASTVDEDIDQEPEESILKQFQKLNSENKLVLCAQCRVASNTWLGRKLVETDVLACLPSNFLEREQFISMQTAKQNRNNTLEKKTKPLLFLCECYSSSPETVLVNFRPLQKMPFNAVLGVFLKEYIPKVMVNINQTP